MKPFKIIEERETYNTDGRIVIVETDLTTPEGKKITWRFAKVPDIVIIFPLDSEGKVHLKKEWRANRKDFVWGLPSGVIDKGETAEEAALRELQEEVGVKADKFTKLVTVFPTNHIRAHFHIFLAEGLSSSILLGDEHEILEVSLLPFDEAYNLVVKQQIPTAQDALAFTLVAKFKKI
jgi:8-oxo-dGTP pyrophosphatase MutT (NUDIX family)